MLESQFLIIKLNSKQIVITIQKYGHPSLGPYLTKQSLQRGPFQKCKILFTIVKKTNTVLAKYTGDYKDIVILNSHRSFRYNRLFSVHVYYLNKAEMVRCIYLYH